MARIADTLESKRGKNRLKKYGDKAITHLIKLLEFSWVEVQKQIKDNQVDIRFLNETIAHHKDILPYIASKQPIDMNIDANVVNPAQVLAVLTEIHKLKNNNDDNPISILDNNIDRRLLDTPSDS
jgi:hypothetical protein